MDFSPVWISTVEHLSVFRGIVRGAAPEQLRAARLSVPGWFPQARPLWGLVGMRVPLVFRAAGRFAIDDDALRFRSTRYRVFGSRISGLDDELVIELPLARVVSAERWRFESPVGRGYDLEFVRVRSALEGVAADFLVTLGVTLTSMFFPTPVEARREAFLARVEQAVSVRGWSRGSESDALPDQPPS